jgi:hypothetical protein
MATIIAATIIGVRAWMRVELSKSEAKKTSDQGALMQVEALRKEVAQLRDTATRYDISFDTALQRLEARVGHMEGLRYSDLRASQEEPVTQSVGQG